MSDLRSASWEPLPPPPPASTHTHTNTHIDPHTHAHTQTQNRLFLYYISLNSVSEKVEEVARNMTALSETIRAIEEEMEMENLTILHVRSLSNVCGVLKLSHVNHSSLKLLFSVLQKCKTTLLRYVPAWLCNMFTLSLLKLLDDLYA